MATKKWSNKTGPATPAEVARRLTELSEELVVAIKVAGAVDVCLMHSACEPSPQHETALQKLLQELVRVFARVRELRSVDVTDLLLHGRVAHGGGILELFGWRVNTYHELAHQMVFTFLCHFVHHESPPAWVSDLFSAEEWQWSGMLLACPHRNDARDSQGSYFHAVNASLAAFPLDGMRSLLPDLLQERVEALQFRREESTHTLSPAEAMNRYLQMRDALFQEYGARLEFLLILPTNATSRISKACSKGEIDSIGFGKSSRMLDPSSFDAWIQAERDALVDRAEQEIVKSRKNNGRAAPKHAF